MSCHSPPPGDLPNSEIKAMSPASPALARGFFTISATWEAPFSNSLPILKFSSVQSLSPVQLFETSWTAACQASLSITNYQSLLKLIFIRLVMPSNHLILCNAPLLCLQSFPASGYSLRNKFFASGGQSIGVSALASVLPKNYILFFLYILHFLYIL